MLKGRHYIREATHLRSNSFFYVRVTNLRFPAKRECVAGAHGNDVFDLTSGILFTRGEEAICDLFYFPGAFDHKYQSHH